MGGFGRTGGVARCFLGFHIIMMVGSLIQFACYNLISTHGSPAADIVIKTGGIILAAEAFAGHRPTHQRALSIARLPSAQPTSVHLHPCRDKIKRNTAELRSTLTSKYENLVDCSTLLSSIKEFTQQIAAIEQDISRVYRAPVSEQELEAETKRSIVSVVEELLYKKKYSEAMKRSFRVDKAEQRDVDYLPFLRIQILEGLEAELLSKKFTKSFIQELITCLGCYIEGLSPSEK